MSAAPLNSTLIRIDATFYYKLNQKAYGLSMQTIKQRKYYWYLGFFHYIWFIDSENLRFILILKEKLGRVRHLLL